MSTMAVTSSTNRSSLLRSIALGGIVIGTLDLIILDWLILNLIYKNPFLGILQFVTSGLIGNAAFTGGLATALLGLLLHYLISFVVASVFIFSATRIPLLRKNVIVGSLLYGIGVFVVLNMIVIPFSAAPKIPPPAPVQLILMIIDHMLVVGLPLGILVKRNGNFNQ